MLEDPAPASTVLSLETKVKSGLRKMCCAAGWDVSQARLSRGVLHRMGIFQGSISQPGGRAACWMLTHLVVPREAELHPPALKWVISSSHPLQPNCAMASAVLARRHITGHSWISRISAYLRQQEEAQEHLKDTCRDPCPVPCSQFKPQLCLPRTAHPGWLREGV